MPRSPIPTHPNPLPARPAFPGRNESLQRTREATAPALPDNPDLVVLSHLRWDFVYQRPQHLMSRFARERRVFFFEEPLHEPAETGGPRLVTSERKGGVVVAVPHLPHGMSGEEAEAAQAALLA